MTSPELSQIPIEKRRKLAATVGLFAVLFIAVGAVAATGPSTTGIKVFVVLAFLVAFGLGLVSWGITTSVKRELGERRLDDAINEVVAARGGMSCGCGHDHDPNELHITDEDETCAHDGAGAACAHDCDSCVLTALRREPAFASTAPQSASVAANRRPSPRPQPSGVDSMGYAPAHAARPRPRPTA